jgi:antitoxin PrlF
MLLTSTLTARNQTTLPKQVVKALHLKPAAKLSYEVMNDGTVLLTSKTETFASLAGQFAKRRVSRPVRVEDMKAAAQRGAAEAFKKSMR